MSDSCTHGSMVTTDRDSLQFHLWEYGGAYVESAYQLNHWTGGAMYERLKSVVVAPKVRSVQNIL